MPFATLNRYGERLLWLLRAIWSLPEAHRERRGGRELLRALARAGGFRRACRVLIEYTSLHPGEQARRYRRWIEVTESEREEHPVKVVLAVSFRGLDEEQRGFLVENLTETARCARVFIDVGSDLLGELGARGVEARRMPAAGPGSELLPADCLGVVVLGRACCLHRDTLRAMTRALKAGADMVYGDSDRIDMRRRRRLPYFKPDYSPDLLFHQDYISDCVAISRRIWDGKWRFDDPYASVLRTVHAATRIEHVPAVLSHAMAAMRASRQRLRVGAVVSGPMGGRA